MNCAEFEDALADVAVDAVAEPQRSALLAHADGCASCTASLADMVAVTDALLHLAPEAEPPVGFESRAVARMADADAPRSARRPWARAAVAAAVLVAALAGVAAGRWTGDDGAEAASGPIVTASGARVGTADLEDGRIVLTMPGEARWSGRWMCQLLDEGRWVDVAGWTAAEVHGGVWAAGVPAQLNDATMMRILDDDGRVIATATLA